MLRFSLICSAALLLTGCAADEGTGEAPSAGDPALELTGRVVDAADIFSPQFEEDLTAKLSQLESDTLVQLAVVSAPTLEGYDIADYSLNLANAWGVGNDERDDGLMLLIAPNERRLRIEVGYGLEASVRDEEARLIIDRDILPHFEASDYEAGVDAGVDSLIREVAPIELKDAA